MVLKRCAMFIVALPVVWVFLQIGFAPFRKVKRLVCPETSKQKDSHALNVRFSASSGSKTGMAKPKLDTLFPTMVVGSLPRPRWVVDIIQERTSGALSWAEADRLLDTAVLGAIRMQERSGLDYISDGECRRENYVRVFADKVVGFRRARVERGPLTQLAFVEKPVERHGPIVADDTVRRSVPVEGTPMRRFPGSKSRLPRTSLFHRRSESEWIR